MLTIQVTGEDFLWYKRTHNEAIIYLEEDCEKALSKLTQQNKLKCLKKGNYKVNEKWVKE